MIPSTKPSDEVLAYIREHLEYVEEGRIGYLRWKTAPRTNPYRQGRKAGTFFMTSRSKYGYTSVGACRRKFLAHNIIWFLCKGEWPSNELDHREHPPDGEAANDWIGNLREANSSQQTINQRVRKSNTSGYRGVSWDRRRSKYEAYITLNCRRKFCGYFNTPEEAAAARMVAQEKYHDPEFTNHGTDIRAGGADVAIVTG